MSAEILAPMPGLIIEILVNTGDTVRQYQPVLILEAMKMENQIVAPSDGTVAEIKVKVEDTVSTEQVLMVLE